MDSRWGKRPPKWTQHFIYATCWKAVPLTEESTSKEKGNRFADGNQAFVFGRVECEVILRHLTGDVKKTAGYTDPKL